MHMTKFLTAGKTVHYKHKNIDVLEVSELPDIYNNYYNYCFRLLFNWSLSI